MRQMEGFPEVQIADETDYCGWVEEVRMDDSPPPLPPTPPTPPPPAPTPTDPDSRLR